MRIESSSPPLFCKSHITFCDANLTPCSKRSDSSGNGENGIQGMGDTKSSNHITRRRGSRRKNKSKKVKPPGNGNSEGTPKRRVVKGKPPPDLGENRDPTDSIPSAAAPNGGNDPAEDKDIERDAVIYALPGSALATENETMKGVAEKRMKERIDDTRTKKYEKVIEQRRKSVVEEGAPKSPAPRPETLRERILPSIFSVANKNPEHKRTVGLASLSKGEEEPLEKRPKLLAEEEGCEDDASTNKSPVSWVKAAAVAVAVIAGIAFLRGRVQK